jgi:hypothetical protein
MPGGPPRNFRCPECGAFYKLVRVPRPESSELPNVSVFCVHCDHPLAAKDNGFLLKYLMVARPNERYRQDTLPTS